MKNVFATATAAAVATLLISTAATAAPGDAGTSPSTDASTDQSAPSPSGKKWLDTCIIRVCAPVGETAAAPQESAPRIHMIHTPFGDIPGFVDNVSPFTVRAVNAPAQLGPQTPPANLPNVR